MPGHPEVPPLDYEHLLTLESLGEESLVPEGMKERVIVKDLLDGIDLSRPRRETFIPKEKETMPVEIKVTPPPTEKKSLLLRIFTAPKYIGQLIFDIIKYDKADNSSKMLLGYAVLVITVLIFLGIISPDALKSLWRFFFPE